MFAASSLSASPLRSAFSRAVVVGAFLLLGACAHHPKKVPPPPPPLPPYPTQAELQQANSAYDGCLHREIYRMEDGRISAVALSHAVAEQCRVEFYTLSVLESRRTHDRLGAYVIYRAHLQSAEASALEAVTDYRAQRAATLNK